MTLCNIFIFQVLIVIPCAESIKCSKNSTFEKIPLNSLLSSIYAASLNDSNDNNEQYCIITLTIDSANGLIYAQFNPQQYSNNSINQLYSGIHIYI